MAVNADWNVIEPQRAYTTNELIGLLGIHRNTLYEWTRRGFVECRRGNPNRYWGWSLIRHLQGDTQVGFLAAENAAITTLVAAVHALPLTVRLEDDGAGGMRVRRVTDDISVPIADL